MSKSPVQKIKDILNIDTSMPLDLGDKRVWIDSVTFNVHRDYGPAIEYKNGAAVWVNNGEISLEDFSEDKIKVTATDSELIFYVNGMAYSEEIFMKVFL